MARPKQENGDKRRMVLLDGDSSELLKKMKQELMITGIGHLPKLAQMELLRRGVNSSSLASAGVALLLAAHKK